MTSTKDCTQVDFWPHLKSPGMVQYARLTASQTRCIPPSAGAGYWLSGLALAEWIDKDRRHALSFFAQPTCFYPRAVVMAAVAYASSPKTPKTTQAFADLCLRALPFGGQAHGPQRSEDRLPGRQTASALGNPALNADSFIQNPTLQKAGGGNA
jgi:hypothetical protein